MERYDFTVNADLAGNVPEELDRLTNKMCIRDRKQRTHRLIERGAILESAINEICPADTFSNEDIQKIVYYAILAPSTIDYIAKMGV